MKNSKVCLNRDQRLYVIATGAGYSCLGFEVCEDWTKRIAQELERQDLMPVEVGTLEAYAKYEEACEAARQSQLRGKTLTCMLTPQLMGLEGKRVEVVDKDNIKRQFIVGKSTGWLPIHIMIPHKDSRGGMSVIGAPFKSVRTV